MTGRGLTKLIHQSFKLQLKTETHDIVSGASCFKVLYKRACTLQIPIPFNLTIEDYVLPNKEGIGKPVKDVVTTYN